MSRYDDATKKKLVMKLTVLKIMVLKKFLALFRLDCAVLAQRGILPEEMDCQVLIQINIGKP